MPPKEQLSEEINNVLGTEMDFSRMTKEDLELLHDLILEGVLIEPLIKQVAKDHGKDKLDEVIDDYYVGKYAMRLLNR
jgi:hypothetical protein